MVRCISQNCLVASGGAVKVASEHEKCIKSLAYPSSKSMKSKIIFSEKNVNLNPEGDTLREDFATQFSVYPKTRYQSWCFWTFRITLTSSSLFWRSFSPISCISLRKQKLCNIRVTDFSDLDFKTQIHYFFIVVYLLLVRFWTIAVATNLFFCDI